MAISLKQAMNRRNAGHEAVLRAFARGERVFASSDPHGIRKAHRTLVRWGAVIDGERALTDFGRELLSAIQAKKQTSSELTKQAH